MKSTFFTTICTCLALVTAAPVAQHAGRQQHAHHKRVDWDAIDYDFSGVDWSTVNYDLSNVNWATVFTTVAPATTITQAATLAVAAASPYETEQVTINSNAVQAIPNKPATTAAMYTTTPVAAGNVATYYATTTTSAAAVAAATTTYTTTNTASSGKRGLGWDPSSPVSSAANFVGSEVAWYFDWSTSAISGMPSGWQFYANIWNAQGIENLATTLSGKPKLIGFNEPDSTTQANIGVSEAISLYQQYLVPLKSSGIISELGTPAVTNSANTGEGLDYLSNFVNGCSNCQLDFAVVHWYAEDIEDFKSHVTKAHTLTGLPVNVAEFAYTAWSTANEPSAEAVMNFMTAAIAWLDAQSFVQAYAWFGAQYISEAKFPALGSNNSLIDENLDALTALGQAYCD